MVKRCQMRKGKKQDPPDAAGCVMDSELSRDKDPSSLAMDPSSLATSPHDAPWTSGDGSGRFSFPPKKQENDDCFFDCFFCVTLQPSGRRFVP